MFALGQRVIVSDYLVRCRVAHYQLPPLAECWEGMPPVILEKLYPLKFPFSPSLTEATFPQDILPPNQRPLHGGGGARLWIPNSALSQTHLPLGRDTRNNPAPYGLELPREGVVIQKVQLQDGYASPEEYSIEWTSLSTRVGYKVAYSLSRIPITVLPQFLTPLEDA